jgi:hypothetical protein
MFLETGRNQRINVSDLSTNEEGNEESAGTDDRANFRCASGKDEPQVIQAGGK